MILRRKKMELKQIQKDIWQNKLNKGFNTTDVNKEFNPRNSNPIVYINTVLIKNGTIILYNLNNKLNTKLTLALFALFILIQSSLFNIIT